MFIRQEVSYTVLKILNMQDAGNCEHVTEVQKAHTPTNALSIKLQKGLKCTLKSLWHAPTCFGLPPSSASPHYGLAKYNFS